MQDRQITPSDDAQRRMQLSALYQNQPSYGASPQARPFASEEAFYPNIENLYIFRDANSLEVWWIGMDSSVRDANWYEGNPWNRFTLAPTDSASMQGGITSVSRTSNSMEIWWISTNGSVQGSYWYEGGSWTRYELVPVRRWVRQGSCESGTTECKLVSVDQRNNPPSTPSITLIFPWKSLSKHRLLHLNPIPISAQYRKGNSHNLGLSSIPKKLVLSHDKTPNASFVDT
jgi:hypothetical protein